MSYIEKIFNKNIIDFKIEDLRSFFKTEQEETSILEFKSGKIEINDIYKEITAFLNTEGGLLIIGAPIERKEKSGKNEKVICTGELTYSQFRNKDWLYQKIASNIVPTPVGLKIFEHIDSSGSIFVIDIPQSTIPPHQCSADGKYYIRLERDAKPAPHGIIQALFQKRKLPKLDADIKINSTNEDTDNVVASIMNLSDIPADKVSFLVDVYNVNDVECKFGVNGVPDTLGYKYTISGNADNVLVRVLSMPIEFTVNHKMEEYVIFVGFWCKELDFDFKFWTYNPSLNQITCEDRFHYEKVSFIDELERVTKKT